MHLIARDLRYGARLLWKAPGFSVLAMVALALGMGATTAIFSVVYAVLLKPLPFREPERLLVIWEKNPAQNRYKLFVAPVNFLEWRRESREMEGMAAFQDVRITLTGGPNGHFDPEELRAQRVTADLFPLLGVQPVAGRAFRTEEDQPGHTNFVLLSHSLWQRRFGGDPAIPGTAIRLRDQTYTVVGVLPPAFSLMTRDVDLWIPLGLSANDPRSSNNRFLTGIGRLRAGTSEDRARAEMETLGSRLEQAYPALNKGWRPSLFGLESELTGHVRQALWVLLGAVGFLLVMACVNVANLLLARGATRRKEIAVRTALGAGRSRIVAQLLSESMILALGSGLLGMLLAGAGVGLMARLGQASIPRLAEARLDANLFLFAVSISLATGILFGIAPAWQTSGANLNEALTEGGRGGTTGRSGRLLRDSLVVLEVALAVLLLIGAGLLVRSFARLRSVDPGFQPSGLLTARIPMAGGRNATPERRAAFFQQVLDRLAALPGVQSAGGVNGLPLTGLGVGSFFALDGRPAPMPEQRPMSLLRSVTPGYFRTTGIPLVAGRLFTEADAKSAAPVILVNQTLVRRFWSQGNPLGGRLVVDTDSRTAEIVGVVGDVKPERIESEDWPTIYDPYAQAPVTTMNLIVRTARPPLSLASAVEREVHRLDPDQAVANIRTMDTVVDDAFAGARFNTVLLGVFAAIAFTLAAVGIYGVISYDVTRRTHELGIRLALGAQPGDVLRLVVGHGARLAATGIGAGLAAAYGLTRLMSTMLFGVNATDFYTFAAIPVLLGAVALLASYLPSRRAMALDPVTALRHE
ncbi:MAG TPA: ABC transporter permease [Candidatus Acidoferrales bacterium]|nr:ABC transporter permease [Candidatus Acidoferrales bacterium]